LKVGKTAIGVSTARIFIIVKQQKVVSLQQVFKQALQLSMVDNK
jgi:hypothetical protein